MRCHYSSKIQTSGQLPRVGGIYITLSDPGIYPISELEGAVIEDRLKTNEMGHNRS